MALACYRVYACAQVEVDASFDASVRLSMRGWYSALSLRTSWHICPAAVDVKVIGIAGVVHSAQYRL